MACTGIRSARQRTPHAGCKRLRQGVSVNTDAEKTGAGGSNRPGACRRRRRGFSTGICCNSSTGSDAAAICEPQMGATAMSFAPCTVANLGVGYDIMGAAAEGQGDVVEARVIEADTKDSSGQIVVSDVVGDGGRLSLVADENCCGIAARETLRLIAAKSGRESCLSPNLAISLRCLKGLPLGSGLGSSAASAAAAAWAVNALFGHPMTRRDLVAAGLVSEAAVSGYHADNIAPALMGGFVLIESYKPSLIMHELSVHRGTADAVDAGLWFGLVTPVFEAPTREMRKALPAEIPMSEFINNTAGAATLCAALAKGDVETVGRAMANDVVVEPRRGPLIPGFDKVKQAAMSHGAHGCTISGAGPTAVALGSSREQVEAAVDAMCDAFSGFHEIGCAAVCRPDFVGARDVDRWEVPRGDTVFIKGGHVEAC